MARPFETVNDRSGAFLRLQEPWSDRVAQYVDEQALRSLCVDIDPSTPPGILNEVAKLEHLEGLAVILWAKLDVDLSPIERLQGLRRLVIRGEGRQGVDYTAFPRLESASVEMWRKGADSVLCCQGLRHLELEMYTRPDLAALAELPALEELEVIKGRVACCAGIEGLPRLKCLKLRCQPKLRALDLTAPLPRLEALFLEECDNLTSFSTLENASRLRLFHYGERLYVDSFYPLAGLTDLEWLSVAAFPDDNDMHPLLALERLWYLRVCSRSEHREILGRIPCTTLPYTGLEGFCRLRDMLRKRRLPGMEDHLEALRASIAFLRKRKRHEAMGKQYLPPSLRFLRVEKE